jgi:hypothetical protein
MINFLIGSNYGGGQVGSFVVVVHEVCQWWCGVPRAAVREQLNFISCKKKEKVGWIDDFDRGYKSNFMFNLSIGLGWYGYMSVRPW